MSKCRGGGSERWYLAGWRRNLLRRGCCFRRRAGRGCRAGVPRGRRAAARGAAQEGVAEGAAPRERRGGRRHREREGQTKRGKGGRTVERARRAAAAAMLIQRLSRVPGRRGEQAELHERARA